MPSGEQQQIDFWRSVEQPQVGCWEWQRGRQSSGYGTVWYRAKRWVAHRLAWHLAVGEIPEGVCVLHTCDNPPCCNPAHLWLGTMAENNRDCVTKGRHGNNQKTHCKRGHEFNEENTTYSPSGARHCKACCRLWWEGKKGKWKR